MMEDRRFKFLTSKQREIAGIAKEKGYVTLGDIKMFYSSKEHWSRAVEKLVAFNILIPDKKSGDGNVIFTKLNYNGSMEEDNVQKTLKRMGIG